MDPAPNPDLVRALLALAVFALGACADAPPDAGPTLSVRGLYIEPLFDGEAIRVNHEAIPDRMPAMVMDFRLGTPTLADDLAEGTPVRLTLDSASLRVLDVEALPSETDLDLGPGSGGGGAVFLPDDPDPR